MDSLPRTQRTVTYVAMACGFEACSAVLTARVLAVLPFGLTVACLNLGLGCVAAVPFILVGARPAPTLASLPANTFVAAVAMACETCVGCWILDPAGLAMPLEVDLARAYESVDGAFREVRGALGFALTSRGALKPQALALDPATTFATLATAKAARTHVLAAAVGLDGVGALLSRKLSNAGAVLATAAVGAACYVAQVAADRVAEAPPALGSGFASLADDGGDAELHRWADAFLAAVLVGLGVASFIWTSAISFELALADPDQPSNMVLALSLIAFALLLPYALLLEGPALVAWLASADASQPRAVDLATVARHVLTAATASHLSRELQAHLVPPKLSASAFTAVMALRRAAAVLAIALVTSVRFASS